MIDPLILSTSFSSTCPTVPGLDGFADGRSTTTNFVVSFASFASQRVYLRVCRTVFILNEQGALDVADHYIPLSKLALSILFGRCISGSSHFVVIT